MDLILADHNYLDIKVINYESIDFDAGDTNDFQLVIRRSEFDSDYKKGNLVYLPDSEFGGVIGEIDTDTSIDTITIKGFIFRGYLQKKIISPASGQDYKIVSGELNTIIRSFVDSEFSGLILGSEEDSGETVSGFQFERHCTLYDGLNSMLKSVGYKLKLTMVQEGLGIPAHVIVEAVPIVDYSDEIELSQDSRLNFIFQNRMNGVNHLICLGKGELKDREVIHLYVQQNGTIGNSKAFFGLNEIVEVYDYSSAESTSQLREEGTKRLQEIMNNQTFEMNVISLDIDVEIGDIIGGQDYLTGLKMKSPVKGKVFRSEGGEESLTYTVEEN